MQYKTLRVLLFGIVPCLFSYVAFASSDDDLLFLIAPIIASRCTITLDKTSLSFDAFGGAQTVAITASGSSCVWVTEVPSEASTWLSVTSGTSGCGSATVTARANAGTDSRSATIQVAGQAVSISQAGLGAFQYILPDTGQTRCYSNSRVITCPSAGEDFYGQDGNYQGVQMSYQDNGDGTVSDLVTGLMWQQADDGTTRTWADAGTYCSELSLGDHTDWRLPSRMELSSILDSGRVYPAINPVFSCSSEAAAYWSGTISASDSDYVWYTYFAEGGTTANTKIAKYLVRCVRGGPLPESVYVDNGDATVTNQTTGLMWEKASSSDSSDGMTWEQALAWCENATTGGYSDWRLPTKREQDSLWDDSRYPAINPIFTGDKLSMIRSGTTVANDVLEAWNQYVLYGVPIYNDKTNTPAADVRCVRGGPH